MSGPIAASEPLIELIDVDKRHGQREILKSFSLRVLPRRNVLLTGPNGAGKSTILRLILLLDKVDRGAVRYCGQTVTSLHGSWTAGRKAGLRVGYVGDQIDLWPHLTVTQNLALVLRHATDLQADTPTIERLLGRFSAADKAHLLPDQLSAGEKRRVALARAMASAPQILVLDEVTSNVDASASREVFDCLTSLTKEGVTLVFSSHDKSIPPDLFPEQISYASVSGWGA